MIFASSIQAQNQEIQKVIETFFEGFHAKDTVKMKSVCFDKIILQSIMENAKGSKLSDESAKEFYNSIATIPSDFKFEEKILSYSIQVDGTMAHAWTPYEFYINGKLSHSGVNAFTLFKENGIWKIIYVIDTRRK
jgi:hypothetical protein